MAITLENIQNRLERRMKDINFLDQEDLYDMATDLNQFLYREMVGADPERFIIPEPYTVSSSPSTQSLPDGFRDIQQFGCGFFIQRADGSNSPNKLTMTGYGATDIGYYFDGANVVFTGISNPTVIILRYIPTIDDITGINNPFCVPDENKDLVTEGMVVNYYKYAEDPRESIADQRFARLLAEFLTKLRKKPKVYGLTNFQPYY